ncbi:hypothetical protein KRR40_12930 [Niabella defluvii]|nr:hypothetical protein KRR40_12930 [Niabella sp. I65]
MITSVVHIIGVKVKGRILVNRQELCRVLGIKSSTLSNKARLFPELKKARVNTVGGEMWDLSLALSIKILPNENPTSNEPVDFGEPI